MFFLNCVLLCIMCLYVYPLPFFLSLTFLQNRCKSLSVTGELLTVHFATSRLSNDLMRKKNFTSANAARSAWITRGSQICRTRQTRMSEKWRQEIYLVKHESCLDRECVNLPGDRLSRSLWSVIFCIWMQRTEDRWILWFLPSTPRSGTHKSHC